MQKTRPAEFIALVAFLTALVAMSIDTMLPATALMARELGANQPNDQQLIILGFFAGQMLGIPVFGPWSDSIGRKPAIFVGLALYIVGALICMLSGSFYVLITGRVLQGIGAAAPRIVAMAMVRDGAKGAAMARIMSFVMSVFMLVPILAPFIGQQVLNHATWRYIFGGFVVAAILVGIWLSVRQEETLTEDRRQLFSTLKLWMSAKEVVNNPVSFGYTIATGFVFGVFVAYLGVCRQIFVDQYHVAPDHFPYWFGSFAVFIALAMITNGRTVGKLGMRKLSKWAMIAYAVVWVLILAACMATAGSPSLFILAPLFAIWFFSAGFTFGNFSAMSMEPMGHIAGMAAAVSGFISQAMAIVLGGFAGRFYDGTLTSIATFFAIYSVCALICVEWTESQRRKLVKKTAI
jgi:MFS transporter, DHA1 family, multidrug resistance protein